MAGDEFGGFGLAVGSTRGIRSFRVDKLGRLTGVHHRKVWLPGENVAQCATSDTVDQMMRTITNQKYDPVGNLDDIGHDPAICQCGFYAYYDSNHADVKDQPGDVVGVVEGYGKTVIGSKGFRSQKARIVGLVVPEPADPKPPRKARFGDADPVSLAFNTLLFGLLTLLVTAVGGFLLAPAASGPTITATLLVGFLCGAAIPLAWEVFDVWRANHVTVTSGYGSHYFVVHTVIPFKKLPITERIGQWATLARVAAVSNQRRLPVDPATISRNYPNIPIYGSIDQLTREHPLDQPPPPPPAPTPEDPDFWTRRPEW